MSYVDAMWDREKDIVHIVERDKIRGRLFQEYPARYYFYYPDRKGKYTSIYGDKLEKVSCKNYKEFQKELRIHQNRKLFEHDINCVVKCLEENYLDQEPPALHAAFYDIEVDMQPFAVPSQQIVKIRKKIK